MLNLLTNQYLVSSKPNFDIFFFILLVVALLIGLVAKQYLRKLDFKHSIISTFLSFLIMGLLLFTKGINMIAVKGFILFLILFFASVSDIRERKVSDTYSIMIIITALIGVELSDLPFMFISMIAVGIPQLIIAMISPGTYGGADIKISAAGAFLLGIWKGFLAVMIGLTLSIIVTLIFRILKKQSIYSGIPLVPYLSFGILLMFII